MLLAKADGILDLRAWQDYTTAHIVDSTFMPWDELGDSLNELPAAPASFFLVGAFQAIELCSVLLDAKGYQVSGSLIVNRPQDLQAWGDKLPGLLTSGKDSKRLWSPNPLLQAFVAKHPAGAFLQRPHALDLGCGGGRDAVFLAKAGWLVTGIDDQARVLKRAKQLAQRNGASVKFKCCNLKQADCIPLGEFELVVMARFLNRELLEGIASRIKPGGFMMVHAFAEGAQAFGSPKHPDQLLKAGELAEVFADFDVIVDKIEPLADGRPVASFIAQKPLL